MTHLDHACRTQIDEFVAQQRKKGTVRVGLLLPKTPAPGSAAAPARGAETDRDGDGFAWFADTRG